MPPKIIFTVEELARHVALVDGAQGMARHNAMGAFHLQLDLSRLHGVDPFSGDYKKKVLELYRSVHSSPYDTDSESDVLEYDVENPSPFSSRSPAVVGSHFGAIATLLKDFPAAPPARVLDIGVGWGHTSLLLARTGFEVDALDINQGYLDLVDTWSRRMGVSDRLKTVNVPFAEISTLSGPYDAILFFESFHHAIDHSRLIEDCRRLLKPGGAMVFAGEPIYRDWPVPWSIRSDSLSAYCIHKFGWMELGFHEDYFLEMLFRSGLYGERRTYTDHPIANGYLARPVVGLIPMSRLALPRSLDETWHELDSSGLRWSRGESLLPGSLVGDAAFELHIANYRNAPVKFAVLGDEEMLSEEEFQSGESRTVLVGARPQFDVIKIKSQTWSPKDFGSGDSRELGVAVGAIVIRDLPRQCHERKQLPSSSFLDRFRRPPAA